MKISVQTSISSIRLWTLSGHLLASVFTLWTAFIIRRRDKKCVCGDTSTPHLHARGRGAGALTRSCGCAMWEHENLKVT